MQWEQTTMEKPIKIMVMQYPMTIDPGRLQKVLAPSNKTDLSVANETNLQGVKHAQKYAAEEMEYTLARQSEIIEVTPPVDEQRIINKMRGQALEMTISQ